MAALGGESIDDPVARLQFPDGVNAVLETHADVHLLSVSHSCCFLPAQEFIAALLDHIHNASAMLTARLQRVHKLGDAGLKTGF